MSFEGFSVCYLGEEHVCLSGDESVLVQDFALESMLVIHTHTHTHQPWISCLICPPTSA